MIQYLTRNQLDVEKYNHCISNAFNSRIYGYSWYLDAICDAWDILVKDDYQAVMPLPKRKKYGVSYIYQAPWAQQLGVFSLAEIEESTIIAFIHAIPKKFKLVDVFLNSKNKFSSKYLKDRTNYILALDSDFETLKNNFNTNRKRVCKTNFDNFRIDKKGNTKAFLEFYKNQESNYKTHKDTFEKLQKLIYTNSSTIYIWNVYQDNRIIASLCWLKNHNRITYLAPIATAEAKKENIPTFIINEIIKEHENSNYILDFEGSMIKGVAQFYKSFGAKKETYSQYKKYNLF